jgi:ABC-type Fe3+ transport system permease subunit
VSVAAERAVEAPAQRTARSREPRRHDRPRTLWVVTGLVYAFLFAPILVVILFSFNSARSLQTFEGFSLRWYEDFFADETLRQSLFTSLEIAAITTVAATLLGTTLALGMSRSRSRASGFAGLLLLIPLVTPEIVAGVSAFVLFAQLGIALSVTTIVLAHITFSISYVCVVVRGRLASMGQEIEEAALDLGATPLQAVRLSRCPRCGRRSSPPGCSCSSSRSTTSCCRSSPPASRRSPCRCGSTLRCASGSRRRSTPSARSCWSCRRRSSALPSCSRVSWGGARAGWPS